MTISHVDDDVLYELAYIDAPVPKHVREHLELCPECSDRLHTLLTERERLRLRVPGLADSPTPSARRLPRWVRWVAPVAAAAAITLWMTSGDMDPSEIYWAPIDDDPVVHLRSSMAASEDARAALDAYEARNASRAVEEFERLDLRVGLDDALLVHYASALLNAGHAEQALSIVDRLVLRTLPEPWRARGRWVAATAHVRLDEISRACEVWTTIVRTDGEDAERARGLRERFACTG